MIKYVCIIILVIILLILFKFAIRENFTSNMRNIYGEPLQPCQEDGMTNGSWDNEGKCSELGGGVHQICIKNIAKNAQGFSKNTGQSNWSDQRGLNNHCVCLGAWSLYNAKSNSDNENKILKCDAIPENAFSDNYVSKFSQGWNKWNDLELDNQIINGVESLMQNCYLNETISSEKREKLRNKYCQFTKNHSVLKNRDMYQSHCNQ